MWGKLSPAPPLGFGHPSQQPEPPKHWPLVLLGNPVPAVLQGGGNAALAEGKLADIAPTLLELMGLPQPKEMTGASLINRGN